MARAAAQPKYAPPRATRTRVPFSSAGRRASDGLSPLRAEGPREKVALCAKNGCKAQAKATQRTTWARQGYAALQQAVSGSCSAHRRRSVTGPLRERKQQCTRNTEKAVVKKRRGDQAPPANQERAKKLGMNTIKRCLKLRLGTFASFFEIRVVFRECFEVLGFFKPSTWWVGFTPLSWSKRRVVKGHGKGVKNP